MPTFEEQVEVLSGIDIESSGSTPTQGELSQILKDGFIEVMNRCISLKPEEASDFTRESAEQTSNDSLSLNGSKILSVLREDGTNNQWKPCREISPNSQYLVTDTDSLSYASKYNPVYMIGDGNKISVFPAPGANPNSFKVYYINNQPLNGSGVSLIFSHDDLSYFPESKKYLVVLYAACQSLLSNLAKITEELPGDLVTPILSETTSSLPVFSNTNSIVMPATPAADSVDFTDLGLLGDFITPSLVPTSPPVVAPLVIQASPPSIPVHSDVQFTATAPVFNSPILSLENLIVPDLNITAVPPIVPDISENSVAALATAPLYTVPLLSLDSKPTISDLSIDISAPIPPIIDDHSVDTSGLTNPTFVAPVMNAPDWDDSNMWITTEEDVEMSDARIREIQGKVQEYAARIQESQSVFNKEAAILQKDLKVATSNLESNHRKEDSGLKKYASEVGQYQTDINKTVEEWSRTFQKEYQLWLENNKSKISKYQADIQNNLNQFNSLNQEYQADLQRKVQNAQLQEGKDVRLISKFSSETELYVAQINVDVQEWTNNTNKSINIWQAKQRHALEAYQADINIANSEFQKETLIYQTEFNKVLKSAEMKSQTDIQVHQSELNKYQSDISKEIQEYQVNLERDISIWKQDSQNKIQEYGRNIEKETAKVSMALNNYKSKVDKNVQKFSSDSNFTLTKYQQEVQAFVQEFQSNLSKSKTEFDSNLSKYTAEIGRVSSSNESKIANFNSEIQDYASKVNKVNAEYQQMQGRYTALKQKYDESFQIMYPRQRDERGQQ